MFTWPGVRLYLLLAVAVVSEAKISSGVLVFASPVDFGFPQRLLQEHLKLAVF